MLYITPPHNGHLSITATFFCPQYGGRGSTVHLMSERSESIIHILKENILYRKISKISPSMYKPPKPVTQKTLR